MFDRRKYIKEGFIGAIGSMADYQIRLASAEWEKLGILELSDLEEIEAKIVEYNNAKALAYSSEE